jgi:UTP--glucose-1-phosphate uridylyltransferase
MVELYEERKCSILGVEQVNPSETDKYGVVKYETLDGSGVTQIDGIVEKPAPEVAPSNLAVVGRYILTPEIFHFLENTHRGAGGEIQLTDAIAMLLREQPVLAYQFQGKRYDCGSKLGYLMATVEYAMKHHEVGEAFREYMKGIQCC